MKINNIKILPFLLIILYHMNGLYGQTFGDIEKEYGNFQKSLLVEQSILDSLKNILEERAIQIDNEKEKNQPDKSKVTQLMAGTVIVSNEIESQQGKIEQIKNRINVLKQIIRKSLEKKYTSIIDSLSFIADSNNDPQKKEQIKKKIIYYTEKKLEVAQKIPSLSFRPDKILAIDLNSVSDSLEKAIYLDYLVNALAEVDSQLKSVQSSYSELEQILNLQEKANKFLEEIEFDNVPKTIASQSQNNNRETYATENGLSYDWTSNEISLIPQIEAYINLFQQLNLKRISDVESKWSSPIDSLQNDLSLQDYKNLLLEVEKRLKEYRLILSNKAGMTE